MVIPINAPQEICSNCEENLKVLKEREYQNPHCSNITKIYSAFDYEGGIRKAIHQLKFNNNPHNASVLVDLSYPLLKRFFSRESRCMPCEIQKSMNPIIRFINKQPAQVANYDIIIPTPLHPARKRQRGYNQSELIASRLAFHMKTPMLTSVLIKKVNTPPQSTLSRGERLKNLVEVFQVKNPNLVKGRKILLVDDIMTTGSTLEQCAKALKDAGGIRIDAYVVAMRRRL